MSPPQTKTVCKKQLELRHKIISIDIAYKENVYAVTMVIMKMDKCELQHTVYYARTYPPKIKTLWRKLLLK